ncbi:MAG: type II secretion system protein [Armatimonadota bacterium]
MKKGFTLIELLVVIATSDC